MQNCVAIHYLSTYILRKLFLLETFQFLTRFVEFVFFRRPIFKGFFFPPQDTRARQKNATFGIQAPPLDARSLGTKTEWGKGKLCSRHATPGAE